MVTSVAIHGLLLVVLPKLSGSVPHTATETAISVELTRYNPASASKPIAPRLDARLPAVEKKAPRTIAAPPIVAAKQTPHTTLQPKEVVSQISKHSNHAPAFRQTVEAPPQSSPPPVATAMLIGQQAVQNSMDTTSEIINQRIRRHLESFKYYPASARRRGIEGEVDVGFTLGRDGTADHITVLQGSGYAMLDQAAMQTVRRAQPFPADDGTYRFRLKFQRP